MPVEETPTLSTRRSSGGDAPSVAHAASRRGLCPYLYLDATYLKATCAGTVRNVALLVTVGVSEEGLREVLAVEVAPGERADGYRAFLKGLIERGLRGVRLVISDDHEAIREAVRIELPQAAAFLADGRFRQSVAGKYPRWPEL